MKVLKKNWRISVKNEGFQEKMEENGGFQVKIEDFWKNGGFQEKMEDFRKK